MNLRTSLYLIPCLAISLTAAPAALTAMGLGFLPGAEPQSLAQPPPAQPQPQPQPAQPSDSVTEVARQRYQEGVKAFDAGKFEDARAAFLQAYALKRSPPVLLNIGLSELKSTAVNHAADAGGHFQQFLREATAATPEQRATAEKGIADAKKRAGVIAVTVDIAGADISIDGTSVGKSPLADPVFVTPGKHTVFAQYQGRSAAAVVDVKVGASAPAVLTTGLGAPPPAAGTPTPGGPVAPGGPGPGGLTPAPPPVAGGVPGGTPGGVPGAAPGGAIGQPPAYPPGQGMGTPGVGPGGAGFTTPGMGPGMGTGPGTGPDQVTPQREPFFHWYKRKPIAWVGTGVAGAGLFVGLGFTIAASSASATANNHTDQIKRKDAAEPQHNPDRRTNLCGDKETGAGAVAFYADACATLRNDISRYHTDVIGAAIGWAAFGVGAIGTVVYAMVDWYPKKVTPETTAKAFNPRVLAVTPVVDAHQQGFGIIGSF